MENSLETRCRSHRVRNTVLAVSIPAMSVVGFADASFAGFTPLPKPVTVPLDPTGGQMDIVQGGVQTWVLTYGIPVLFGLTLLGVLIRLGLKWFRKAAKAV